MAVIWSSNEFAHHEYPEPAYLVDPMIPQGGIVVCHGKPGVGKSQLMLTLAHSVNNGTDFLGRWPTEQGRVVIIQVDMTGQIQQDRIRRIVDVVDLSDTFWVVEEDGSIPLINIETMAITQRDVMHMIQDIDPLLIVWDTLRKIHRLPENASESAVTVYQSARKVCPKATHYFVHHNRKESRDPDSDGLEDESFMGNQQWKGSADTTFTLSELGTPPKRLVLNWHKARTAPDTEKVPVILEMDMHTILLQTTRLYK